MISTTYRVEGMTCGHCVRSVTHEITALDGVRDVIVDLATGLVTVASDSPLSSSAVRSAVDEAGYALVAQP